LNPQGVAPRDFKPNFVAYPVSIRQREFLR
jgi:hypothetical protein